MTSENEDKDNARIADRVSCHSRFPSEAEDEDNMRRQNAAGVHVNYPAYHESSSSSSSSNSNSSNQWHAGMTDGHNTYHIPKNYICVVDNMRAAGIPVPHVSASWRASRPSGGGKNNN